jgi:hypothetical protein
LTENGKRENGKGGRGGKEREEGQGGGTRVVLGEGEEQRGKKGRLFCWAGRGKMHFEGRFRNWDNPHSCSSRLMPLMLSSMKQLSMTTTPIIPGSMASFRCV